MTKAEAWPDLPFSEWRGTCAALHRWPRIVGKIRLPRMPPVNHWRQVPLYVTCRGLTTAPIPYDERSFAIDFDFLADSLGLQPSDGASDDFLQTTCEAAAGLRRCDPTQLERTAEPPA